MASIKILDHTKFFMTSDLHFFHANILKYCDRPFSSVEEMHETIIARWNAVVPEDGIVLFCGDLYFNKRDKEAMRAILLRLNGEKIWALGNHDNSDTVSGLEDLFIKIDKRISIRVKDDEVAEGWQRIIADHFPGLSWPYSHVGSWQAFGHHHGALNGKTFPDKDYEEMRGKRKELLHPAQVDVGIDAWDYRIPSYLDFKIKVTRNFLNN